ncbi:phosphoribosylglycinamide formyltransferase [bacterium]|nr:phosphoribosylglycinamide formyltransferase [Candidatus Elulimicrobium humile]
MKPVKIALFASGTGSNAETIIRYFEHNSAIEIVFVLSNKAEAPIVNKAKSLGVRVLTCTNRDVENASYLLDLCKSEQIQYIILAGFLRKIPDTLIAAYPEKIFNIHPSLLPKYGGAGMYGKHVHQAVKEAGETETGITIHYVSEEFDSGRIIAHYSVLLTEEDTVDSIQEKVHQLEHRYFAKTIEREIIHL